MVDSRTEADVVDPFGERGQSDHRLRTELLAEANAHFSRYGYGKTTVADLARGIGFSKAYIYKLYASKQAIGNAVCLTVLRPIVESCDAIVSEEVSATKRLRRLLINLTRHGQRVWLTEPRLHEIITAASAESWSAVSWYRERLTIFYAQLVNQGRTDGEFERKTPLEDITHAISLATAAFLDPTLVSRAEPETIEADAMAVADLILRSLAT